jgi:hypothetical protein
MPPAVPASQARRPALESAQHHGIQFRFCGVCGTTLDQRRPRHPRRGKARGTVYILTEKIVAKISPCTPFSTPLNLSPKQIPYITTLFIVLFFALKIIRERVRLNRLIIAYFFGIKISFNIS